MRGVPFLSSLSVLALLGALALAGCSEPTDEATIETTEPCLVESAQDFSCDDAAGNGTIVDRPHLHDYWKGKDRLVLQDVTVGASPFLCVDEPTTVALLQPADGQAIIQGTATVEATLTWTPQGAADLPAATEFWVKTAADSAPVQVGPAESGQVFTLASANDQTDLPHQVLSAWEFHLRMQPTGPTGCFTYDGEVTLHVEIVRGLDIPLYPGHPDRWQGAEALPLFGNETNVFYYQGGTGGMCLGGPTGGECLWTPHEPVDGAVVPHDAEAVVVTVAAADASPLRLDLAFHGADTRRLEMPDPTTDDGTTRTYVLRAGGRGDGPYALQSQWQVWLLPETEVYSGAYTVEAQALRTFPA